MNAWVESGRSNTFVDVGYSDVVFRSSTTSNSLVFGNGGWSAGGASPAFQAALYVNSNCVGINKLPSHHAALDVAGTTALRAPAIWCASAGGDPTASNATRVSSTGVAANDGVRDTVTIDRTGLIRTAGQVCAARGSIAITSLLSNVTVVSLGPDGGSSSSNILVLAAETPSGRLEDALMPGRGFVVGPQAYDVYARSFADDGTLDVSVASRSGTWDRGIVASNGMTFEMFGDDLGSTPLGSRWGHLVDTSLGVTLVSSVDGASKVTFAVQGGASTLSGARAFVSRFGGSPALISGVASDAPSPVLVGGMSMSSNQLVVSGWDLASRSNVATQALATFGGVGVPFSVTIAPLQDIVALSTDVVITVTDASVSVTSVSFPYSITMFSVPSLYEAVVAALNRNPADAHAGVVSISLSPGGPSLPVAQVAVVNVNEVSVVFAQSALAAAQVTVAVNNTGNLVVSSTITTPPQSVPSASPHIDVVSSFAPDAGHMSFAFQTSEPTQNAAACISAVAPTLAGIGTHPGGTLLVCDSSTSASTAWTVSRFDASGMTLRHVDGSPLVGTESSANYARTLFVRSACPVRQFLASNAVQDLCVSSRVAIGTTAAAGTEALTVIGRGAFDSGVCLTVGAAQGAADDSTLYYDAGQLFIGTNAVLDAAGLTVDGTVTASGQMVAPSFKTLSDARLKRDVVPSDRLQDLDDVLALEVKRYVFVDDDDRRVRTGVIAQELARVMPNAVAPVRDYLPNVMAGARVCDGPPLAGGGVWLRMAPVAAEGIHVHDVVRLRPHRAPVAVHACVVAVEPDMFACRFPDGRAPTCAVGTPVFVYGTACDDILAVDGTHVLFKLVSAVQALSAQVRELTRKNE